MWRPEGATDPGEVGEDAREEQRGRWRSDRVRGRGVARAAATHRGERRGVGVGGVEE
jgi:hypothetical protein